MLNQVILVGKLIEDPNENILKLKINKTYKQNTFDNITVEVSEGLQESIMTYLKKGATIGIKARLEGRNVILKDDSNLMYTIPVAEKITFINTEKTNERNNS